MALAEMIRKRPVQVDTEAEQQLQSQPRPPARPARRAS